MVRLELLIDMARKMSGNTRYDSNSGIPQDVFTQFFNNAQTDLMNKIIAAKSHYLRDYYDYTVVNGQLLYSYPPNLFMQSIENLSWAQNANQFIVPLTKSYVKERVTSQPGYAYGYIPRETGFELNPPISVGTLQMAFNKKRNKLQFRCGQITAVTVVGSTISALTVAVTGSYDTTELNKYNYLCVCDRNGVQTAKNIVYTSESAGVFTMSSQTLDGTIAVGDYVLAGKDTVNLPEWPDSVEAYLLKYARYEAKFMDSSVWTTEAAQDMMKTFESILEVFKNPDDDICEIPVTNLDYLSLD